MPIQKPTNTTAVEVPQPSQKPAAGGSMFQVGAAQPQQVQAQEPPQQAAFDPLTAPATVSVVQTAANAAIYAAIEAAKRAQDERAAAYAARSERRNTPFRFWMPVGKWVRLVLLDREFGNHNQWYEHRLLSPEGKWDDIRRIPAGYTDTPISNIRMGDRQIGLPHFVTAFTAAEVYHQDKPRIDKDGNAHRYDRRILALTGAESARYLQIIAEQGGSPRGLVLQIDRLSDRDPRTGIPRFVGRMTEEQIQKWFGSPEVVGKDGRVLKKAGADAEPVDYSAAYPLNQIDDLCRIVGISAPGRRNEVIAPSQRAPDPTPGADLLFSDSPLPPMTASGGSGGTRSTVNLDDEIPF